MIYSIQINVTLCLCSTGGCGGNGLHIVQSDFMTLDTFSQSAHSSRSPSDVCRENKIEKLKKYIYIENRNSLSGGEILKLC